MPSDLEIARGAVMEPIEKIADAAGFAPEILPAMILGKLAGGFSAIAVAMWLTRNEQ